MVLADEVVNCALNHCITCVGHSNHVSGVPLDRLRKAIETIRGILHHEYVVLRSIHQFGYNAAYFCNLDLRINAEPQSPNRVPLFGVEVHLLLELPLDCHDLPRAGAVAAVVDIDIAGVEEEVVE